ncbi:MAG: DUF222 domain-containing protein, partial [Aeromicrobium sp.]
GDARERARAIQTAQDAQDAAKADALAEIDATEAYEIDGASTLNTWVRNELRMTAADASVLVRAAATFAALPLVGAAAACGSIRADHVKAFTYGLKHLGPDIMGQYEEAFVVVGQHTNPQDLFDTIRQLRETLFPDDLEKRYLNGQDKEDISITALLEGWHVSGFLGPVTGAKFKAVLDSVSAPRDEHDDRTGAERRVQGFGDLLDAVLENGLPSDKGVRPHMSVFADADTVEAAADHVRAETEHPDTVHAPMPPTVPATLAGYGSIGPSLLMYFLCVSDFTAFLMKDRDSDRQAQILNVGRTHRLATMKQRRAVIARQHGVCAAPGCRHTRLEIHHSVWYSRGGPTDLDLLIGLCSRCHHLVHKNRLIITGNAVDGYDFTTRTGRHLTRRRTSYRQAA